MTAEPWEPCRYCNQPHTTYLRWKLGTTWLSRWLAPWWIIYTCADHKPKAVEDFGAAARAARPAVAKAEWVEYRTLADTWAWHV